MCVHKKRIKVFFVLFFPTMQEYLIPMMKLSHIYENKEVV